MKSKRDLTEGLEKLLFLSNIATPFTVDEARQVVRHFFTKKLKGICHWSSSYGIKHDFERLSMFVKGSNGHKYCSNDTVKEAFSLEGFSVEICAKSPNVHFNISTAELKALKELVKDAHVFSTTHLHS